jgi:hypothetical protein
MKDMQTLLGAYIASDHNLVVAKISTTLNKIINFHKEKQRWVWRSYTLNDRKCTIVGTIKCESGNV